jgi:hypothetical protein
VPEKVDGLVDEYSSLKKAQAREAFQQDASLGLQESHWVRASPCRQEQHLSAPPMQALQ